MKSGSNRLDLRLLAALALALGVVSAAPRAMAIPVLPAAAAQAADEDLEDKVRGALGATIGKPAQEIGVSVRNGAVLLFGSVRTPSVRSRAERAVRNVLGVRAVENALTVVRGT